MAGPAINFYGGVAAINNLAGSGLGFFGSAGFGASVAVGAWQGRTFITDGNGINQGPETWNISYLSAPSGFIGQTGSGLPLTSIPNYQATLNIEFVNPTSVKTQNCYLTCYDRSSINNPPSGVTTAVAELIHPNTIQNPGGSGSATWQFPAGSSIMPIVSSPGTSGLSPAGVNTQDTTHDWFFAISASPTSIGAKNLYGLYVYVEYL